MNEVKKVVKEKLEKYRRVESLAKRLEVYGECVFSNNGDAIKIEEGCESDYIYNIYNSSGEVLDGGSVDGSAERCIKFVLIY